MKLDFKYHQVLACGDIHGEFRKLGYLLKERYQITHSLIIVCGDIGMGFHKPNYYANELGHLNKKIKALDNTLIFVRGNHDDPTYFDGQHNCSNIFLVPDYTVLATPENNILCVGGGISIDRRDRILNKNYWADENCKFQPELMGEMYALIDTVCTHSNPNFVYPFSKGGADYWIQRDPTLLEDMNHERSELARLYHELIAQGNPLHQWFNGHYHWSFTQEYQGVNFNTLDIEEFKIIN